jgi:hypothetical protein
VFADDLAADLEEEKGGVSADDLAADPEGEQGGRSAEPPRA